MPGLLRGMARTAVVAGTATAVSNRVSRRQASAGSSRGTDARAGAAAAVRRRRRRPLRPRRTRSPSSRSSASCTTQGILTDEEFAAQKAKILG